MNTTRWFKILGLVTVFSLLLAGLAGVAQAEEPEKPVIVVALDSDIDHIEPMEFRSDAGYYATANIYEPLLFQKLEPDAGGVILDGQLEYLPNLAESTDIFCPICNVTTTSL